jgi:TolB-like protein/Tfp pilus assembly protein PilF
MSRLNELISEIHRRSLWQVLLIYVGGALVGYEAIQALTEGLGLPRWFPALAVLLFIVGLPVVLATSFVQRGFPSARPDPTLLPDPEVRPSAEVAGVKQVFTWRNAIFGGAIAFGLWGVAVTGWLLFDEGTDQDIAQTSAARKSIAVLPFVNMSADPENEYFSDGMTDDIIIRLSKIADLKVISRTSVMQYKETEMTVRQIGDELGVATILEGGVQRVGDRVRINAQLIDAESDEHLWANQYDRELTDVFEIQTDVAGQIAAALRAELTPEEQERIASKPTDNLEAYNLYLLGRFHWNKRSEEGFRQAVDYFEQAIGEDPAYALAYTGLADSYTLLSGYDAVSPIEVMPDAKASALRAIEIDSTLAEAHTSLAQIRLNYDWDWLGAKTAINRALELNPGYATAHHWHAFYLMTISEYDSALAAMRRAQKLDPLSLIITAEVGWPLFFARRYDEAIGEYRKAIAMDSNFAPAHAWLGLVYVEKGMFEEAIAELQTAVTLSGRYPRWVSDLAFAFAAWGKQDEALALLHELHERDAEGYISPALYSWVYAELGDMDQAFEWLDKAYEERSHWMAALRYDPRFDSLRSDPRFTALLKELALE